MIDWLREDLANPSVALSGGDLPIAIRRHARAKRLTMRLAPDGGELRITLPRWGRTRDALVFAKARTGWIEDQLARIPHRVEIAPGATIPFRGEALRIDWREGASRKPVVADGALLLGGAPHGLSARIRRWLEAEASTVLEQDLAHYCRRGRQDLPQLRLSRAQRRWGSCSGRSGQERSIRVNWRLIMAPDHVRRSVVAHEVAHLVHFDHSPAFHAFLGELFDGDIAAADAWLRCEGRNLYAVFG